MLLRPHPKVPLICSSVPDRSSGAAPGSVTDRATTVLNLSAAYVYPTLKNKRGLAAVEHEPGTKFVKLLSCCSSPGFGTCWQDSDIVARDKWRPNRDLSKKDIEESALRSRALQQEPRLIPAAPADAFALLIRMGKVPDGTMFYDPAHEVSGGCVATQLISKGRNGVTIVMIHLHIGYGMFNA
ncbi:hypothetical protein H920_06304 [Fukomys damarensis]|uniref:Uncharacterized protein n=1 Tax=Fukomys damarensis TaxID=885580 RepID=A0A091DMN7_FUKDA|nr:hypothetical protein H920_06304 [Fukomys damarensis]